MNGSNARIALHEAVQHHANRYLQPGDLLKTAAEFKDWLDENDRSRKVVATIDCNDAPSTRYAARMERRI